MENGAIPGAEALQQLQDRAQIDALMWRYVRTLDRLDADAYPDLYTEDGQLGEGPTAVRGREALGKVVRDMKTRLDDEAAKTGRPTGRMHHVVTNTFLEFIDRDTARLNYYWMQVFSAIVPGEPPRVASAGRGVDVIVRAGGGWLIRQRIVTPQD